MSTDSPRSGGAVDDDDVDVWSLASSTYYTSADVSAPKGGGGSTSPPPATGGGGTSDDWDDAADGDPDKGVNSALLGLLAQSNPMLDLARGARNITKSGDVSTSDVNYTIKRALLSTSDPPDKFGATAGYKHYPVTAGGLRVVDNATAHANLASKVHKFKDHLPDKWQLIVLFQEDKFARSYFSHVIEETQLTNEGLLPYYALLELMGLCKTPVDDASFAKLVPELRKNMNEWVNNGFSTAYAVGSLPPREHIGLRFLQNPSDGEGLNSLIVAVRAACNRKALGLWTPPITTALYTGKVIHDPVYESFLISGSEKAVMGRFAFPYGSSLFEIANIYSVEFGLS
jgi:hypothetical protein